MRTIVFQSVRDQILRMMGWNPAVATDEQKHRCTEYIQCNLRQGWEYAFFPEWMPLEERACADDYDASLTYGLGAIVWDATAKQYMSSAQAANCGHALTDAGWWTSHLLTAPTETVISLEQRGKTKMGELFAVYPAQSDACKDILDGGGRRIDAILGENGIMVLGALPTSGTVWVRFRKQFPKFSNELWTPGSTYPENYVVLWPTTTDEQQGGQCYMARITSAGEWYWELQEFPAIMEQFVMLATMADMLRGEGQMERAAVLDQKSENEIVRVWRVTGNQQGITQRTRFRGCY